MILRGAPLGDLKNYGAVINLIQLVLIVVGKNSGNVNDEMLAVTERRALYFTVATLYKSYIVLYVSDQKQMKTGFTEMKDCRTRSLQKQLVDSLGWLWFYIFHFLFIAITVECEIVTQPDNHSVTFFIWALAYIYT